MCDVRGVGVRLRGQVMVYEDGGEISPGESALLMKRMDEMR